MSDCRLLNSSGIHTCSHIFSNAAYKLHYSVHLQGQLLKQSCLSQQIHLCGKADQRLRNHLHQLLLLCLAMWTPALTEKAVLQKPRVVLIGRSMAIWRMHHHMKTALTRLGRMRLLNPRRFWGGVLTTEVITYQSCVTKFFLGRKTCNLACTFFLHM